MKSESNNRRTKERSADIQSAEYGVTWDIADLLTHETDAIITVKDMLAAALNDLSDSEVAFAMINEAGAQGWKLGLAHLGGHDFHLDVPMKTIILDNNDMTPGALVHAPYFINMLLVSLLRAMRDVWQEKRHGGFDENYVPESVLLLERVRAADCDVMTIYAAWQMREQGQEALWNHILASNEGDIALAFATTLERAQISREMKALHAAFQQWFRLETRVNACDHETLDYMDDLVVSEAEFGRKRAGKICVETLSCLPDRNAYLRGQGDDILRDPLYAGLADGINQTHFMHIIRDSQVTVVQNVGFRDMALAAKIFPNGEMTPETETLKQK